MRFSPRNCCNNSCVLLSCSPCCCVSRRSVSNCARSSAFSSHCTSLCCSSSCISSPVSASCSLRSSSRRETTCRPCPAECRSARLAFVSDSFIEHKPKVRKKRLSNLVKVLAQQSSGLGGGQITELVHEVHFPLGEHAGRSPELPLPLSDGFILVLNRCVQSLDGLVQLEERSLLLVTSQQTERVSPHSPSSNVEKCLRMLLTSGESRFPFRSLSSSSTRCLSSESFSWRRLEIS